MEYEPYNYPKYILIALFTAAFFLGAAIKLAAAEIITMGFDDYKLMSKKNSTTSMLSRGIAGMKGNTLILALPGSTKGAKETMDALFTYILHIFRIIEGSRHD